jgi:hypothetical protein
MKKKVTSKAPLSKPPLLVTRRDGELFLALWRFGVLLRDQIHALCFGGCALRRCSRRLKLLADAGFIVPFDLPLGGTYGAVAFTPGQYAYRLGPAAVGAAAFLTGWDAEAMARRVERGSPTYVAHALAVAQVAVAFHRAFADDNGGLTLAAFWGEIESRHTYEYRVEGHTNWRTDTTKPDALATVKTPDGSQAHCAIEVDMGQMSAGAWQEKTRTYRRYLLTGAFHARYGPEARLLVLTITTTPERGQRLVSLAADTGGLFPVATTLGEITASGPLAPIWTVSETRAPLLTLASALTWKEVGE